MPPPTTPDGVLEHVALSEMYGVLASKSSDPSYAKKAREVLEPMAQADHPDPRVLLALGTRLDHDKQWEAAAATYRRALAVLPTDLKPSDFQLLLAENNLSMALARSGHAAEGIAFIDSAVKASPDAAELYDTRAFVRSLAGQVDGAIADTREAIRLVPMQPRFRLRLIQLLFDANRQSDAANELKALDALSFDPRSLSSEETQQLKDLHGRLNRVSSAADH
jgi:tetratricopeptide (TPR) repeat protein